MCDWWKRWKIAGCDWLSCVAGCVWLVEAVEDCWLWLVVVCSCGCGLWASCRRHGAGVRRHRCYRHHRCVHGRASLSHAVSVWFGRRWGRHWFFGGIPCQLWLGVGRQPLYRPRPRRPQDWSSAQSRQIRWRVSWPSWSQRGRGQGESHGSVFIAAVIDWLIRHSKYQLTKIRRTYVTWHNLVKWQETLVTDYTVLCVIWQFLPVLLKKIQHILLPLGDRKGMWTVKNLLRYSVEFLFVMPSPFWRYSREEDWLNRVKVLVLYYFESQLQCLEVMH